MIGTYLDDFFIKARLGSGSLGETYLAEQPGRQQDVVLKLLNKQLWETIGSTPVLHQQWLDLPAAYRRQSELNGPVWPFTAEMTNGRLYLKSAYLQDGNLHNYLQKRASRDQWLEPNLDWENSEANKAEASAKTAVSLTYHILTRLRDQNVLHSGLKVHGALHPRNIMLSFGAAAAGKLPTTTLYLTDYGQAQLVREATRKDAKPFLGIAPYTPPMLQQTEEGLPDRKVEPLDERADLFALGHLLYYLLHQKQLPVQTDAQPHPQVNDEFKQLAQKAAQEQKDKQQNHISFIEKATYIALTAVRVYSHGSGKDNLWLRWQYALEQLIRDDFTIMPLPQADAEAEAAPSPAVDPIWRGVDKPAVLWPERFSPLLYLPSPEPQAEALPTYPAVSDVAGRQKRSFDTPTFITITNLEETGLPQRRYPVRPGQGFITVGSDPAQDITLPNDEHIVPHHIDLRLQGTQWVVWPRANNTTLAGQPVTVRKSTPWTSEYPLQIGKYILRLFQPNAADDTDQRIGIELLPSTVDIEPGLKLRIGIAIQNKDSERGYFKVHVEDLVNRDEEDEEPPATDDWFTLPQDGIMLNQEEQLELPLYVHPPVDAVAQSRSFAVVVQRITHHPGKQIFHQQKGVVRVASTSAFKTELTADNSRNNGRFLLTITNNSNRPMTFAAVTDDPAQKLRFAAATESTAPPNESTSTPSPPTRRRKIAMPTQIRQLWRQMGVSQSAASTTAPIRHTARRGQVITRQFGQPPTSPRITFPRVARRRRFQEQVTTKINVMPGRQQYLYLWVEPRKRPFRWRSMQPVPFSMTVTPQPESANTPPQTETAVLHTAARLSRAGSLLLLGLLLLLCLTLTGLGAFAANNTTTHFQATHAAAVAFGNGDPDKDGLSSQEEVFVYLTDPLNPDTDGDGIKDGVEVGYAYRGICPTQIDCDGDGIPDAEDLRFMTPTRTPLQPEPFPTSAPSPTPTLIPTVTPTAFPSAVEASAAVVEAVSIRFMDTGLPLQLGDNRQNEPQTADLQFDTSQIPADAQIAQAVLTVAISAYDHQRLPQLQAQLGNVYATMGAEPFTQELLGVQDSATAADQFAMLMLPVPNNDNLLYAELSPSHILHRQDLALLLFFEWGSDRDGAVDALSIVTESADQTLLPTLHIRYSPAVGESE